LAKPYALIARFYDELHPEAPRMNRYARRKILGKILASVRVVCDLGCGTGTTALELARRGLKVYAVDCSPMMCRQAQVKARRAGLPVQVLCADMRSFRLPEPVELVTCEFNPLNHLPRRADLARVARAVA
jgi:2-polyprenyl-3-methyl-5-hydroxy-6-metoxy-1,4-benzoquinol methylase